MTCVGADTFYMKRMENQKRGRKVHRLHNLHAIYYDKQM